MIEVEFFGLVRKYAGVASASVDVQAPHTSLQSVLDQLTEQFPQLAGNCIDDHRLAPGFVANVDGDRFLCDPQTAIADGSSLLIMSSDAGG